MTKSGKPLLFSEVVLNHLLYRTLGPRFVVEGVASYTRCINSIGNRVLRHHFHSSWPHEPVTFNVMLAYTLCTWLSGYCNVTTSQPPDPSYTLTGGQLITLKAVVF